MVENMIIKLVQNIIRRVDFIDSKYKWIEWIFTNESKSAIVTKKFFNTCFLNLPEDKRNIVIREIKNETIENVASLLYELIAYELFRRLKTKPIFKPKIDNKNPDLTISVNGQDFIVDVFLTHSPGKTIKILKENSQLTALNDSGDRAEKITEAIVGKASKYKKLDIPLVLLGFLGDMDILSVENVFESLFGVFRNCSKFKLNDINNGIIARKKQSGVYLPNLN